MRFSSVALFSTCLACNAQVVSAINDEEAAKIALAADEQCDKKHDSACALNALQFRSEKVEASAEGSCKHYGCNGHYKSWHTCQCTAGCETHGNCCDDYASQCAGSAHPGSTPSSPSPDGGSSEPTSGGVDGIYGHPTPGKAYPKHHGFTLMLVEEFDEPLDLDNDPIWTWSDGGLGEGQVRFVKEAITFEDGKMKITASTRQYPSQSCSHAEVAHIGHKHLSSGEFRSKYNMFRYGRYEARIKSPSVKPGNPHVDGNYVSTMFVYRDAKYHHWREIDVEITGDSAHSLTTNALSADNAAKWSSHMADSRQIHLHQNTRTDFHTYAIEWLPDKIAWYVDGHQVRVKHGPGGRVPISDKSMKVMMNLWIFGDGAYFGGKHIHNNHYPMHSEYDWFRFYKWDGDTHYPCAGFGSSCLTSDDHFLSGNNPCDGIEQEGTLHGQQACKASCPSGR